MNRLEARSLKPIRELETARLKLRQWQTSDLEPFAEMSADPREFIGLVGLHIPTAALPFFPCVEIGWRLGFPFWGQGYATEAAGEALRFAFTELKLPEIVSFTAVANRRSQAVMRRLNMRPQPGTFQHPDIAPGHPLREHCLFRLSREGWRP